MDAGKIVNDDAFAEIDRRMRAAGVKPKSDPSFGTIIPYGPSS